jgi:hypothetical protein
MAITKHDAIVAAIVNTLLASPALAGGLVDDETNFDELPPSVTEAIRVELLDSLPQRTSYGEVDWTSTVRVACACRNDKAGAEGKASSRLGAAAYARLMADRTLGGLAVGIDEPRLSTDLTLLSTRIGVLNLDFPVRHSTANWVLT